MLLPPSLAHRSCVVLCISPRIRPSFSPFVSLDAAAEKTARQAAAPLISACDVTRHLSLLTSHRSTDADGRSRCSTSLQSPQPQSVFALEPCHHHNDAEEANPFHFTKPLYWGEAKGVAQDRK